MPLRASSVPAGFDMKIYRTIQWGELANFHMMATRQYRDDQLAGDGWKKNVTERLAEDRTITGAEQEKWLLGGFRNFLFRRFRPHTATLETVWAMDGGSLSLTAAMVAEVSGPPGSAPGLRVDCIGHVVRTSRSANRSCGAC